MRRYVMVGCGFRGVEAYAEPIVKKFSGSAVYKCEFECCGDNDVLIEFEGLHYYAKVFVNGY